MSRLSQIFRLVGINEGVNDKGIFKAFFLAGSSGSGKSFVADNILLGHGLRKIDSDTGFQHLMKKAGKVNKQGQINIESETPQQTKEREAIRNLSKAKITDKQELLYIQNRLGIILDGTGKSFEKILKQKNKLEALGYDTYMVFVDTSLQVALQRDRERGKLHGGRSVGRKIVTDSWNQVHVNLTPFKKLFGKNLAIIKNDKFNSDFLLKIWKQVGKIVEKPPENEIARRWVRAQRNSG